VGTGYDDIHAFMAALNVLDLRVAIDQRKKIAKRLEQLDASQRATARLLGVSEQTVARDLGKNRGAPHGARSGKKANEIRELDTASAPHGAPAWFQTDADPSTEAKRVVRRDDARVVRAERVEVINAANEPLADLPPVPVLYADPPWQYEHVKTENRAIENQYPTMDLDAICALPVSTVATSDAVLFLWATSPKLAEAIRVIDAWGFTYRTCLVWVKDKIGMGYYARQQHELLLVAARGELPVPLPEHRPSSVITESRGDHSAKPAIVYDLIDRMYPGFLKRELFNRHGLPRPGWAKPWGNQA